MSLPRLPDIRVSVLAVLGTVIILVLAAVFPRLRLTLTVLALLFYSVPYIFFTHVWPRRRRRAVARDVWVRELTPEDLRKWYAAGRLTKEEYDRMMRDLEARK